MGEGLIVIWVIGMWIVPIIIASNIWSNKGGSGGAGFALGFFLGWIGVLIAAIATPSQTAAAMAGPRPGVALTSNARLLRECPHCKEGMRRDASVCPHCQRDSEPWSFHENYWWVKRETGQYWLDDSTGEWRLFTGS